MTFDRIVTGDKALTLLGALGGLSWAAGLRGLMADVAGSKSGVEWYGTFVQILLPGTLVGGLLGWAEHLRRTGGRRHWRWLATAPLLFAVAVFISPDVIASALNGEPPLQGGIGGGAIAIPLFGMAGGYALSGRGPHAARIAAGIAALAPVPAWAVAAPLIGDEFALTTPRGAWVALYFYSHMALLELACAIPHRPVICSPSEVPPDRAVAAVRSNTESTTLR